MTALGKAVNESCRSRYLHNINNADSNAGKATTSQCHVIPGRDQGPYAGDKNQTRTKGLRIELCSRKLKDIVLFSSLIQASYDGLGKGRA